MADQTLDILELETNLADVEKPPELKPGIYSAEVQEVQDATSQKGNAYFAIRFVVPPDQIPADQAEFFEDGAVFFYNRLIRPRSKSDGRALYSLRKFIEALGIDPKGTSFDPNDWMGRTCRIRVGMGKDLDGNDRAEVKGVEAGEAAPKPAPRGRARR